jgi:ABC-type dipeptide/oligopeptide/nickel transport system permease component
MLGYVGKKLLITIPLLVLVSIAVFAVIHLAPGDPVSLTVNPGAPQSVFEAQRVRLGIDKPIVVQYFYFLGHVLRGDFGQSVLTGTNVTTLIGQRLPNTLELGLASLVLSYLIALPLGIGAALRRGRVTDHAAMTAAHIGMGVPDFWLGIMLVLFFSLDLGWLPSSGNDSWRSLILPTLALSAQGVAISARVMRSAVLEIVGQDFVRVLRAKGLSEWSVLRHTVRNALLPTISLFGLRLGWLIGGAVIVETVFSWPGVGRLLVDSALHRDYPVVQGVAFMLGASVILANLLGDVLYAVANPRVRLGG